MDRRGFLHGMLGSGALLMGVLPGLDASAQDVGQSLVWTPAKSVQPLQRLPESLWVEVLRPGNDRTPILRMELSTRDQGVRWASVPGEGIYFNDRHELIEVSAYTTVLDMQTGQKRYPFVRTSGCLKRED